jgi:hypothetical protein
MIIDDADENFESEVRSGKISKKSENKSKKANGKMKIKIKNS